MSTKGAFIIGGAIVLSAILSIVTREGKRVKASMGSTELAEGESYLARLTIINQSTRAGAPVEAVFNIRVAANIAGETILGPEVSDEYFAPGETRIFDYPMTIPPGTGGLSGSIAALVRDPTGNVVASATEDVDIVGAPVAEFAYVSAIRQIAYTSHPGEPWQQKRLSAEIDVENIGGVAGVCTCTFQMACAEGNWTWQSYPELSQATLQPGQITTFIGDVLRSSAYGYTCKVRFIGDPGITEAVPMI